MAEQEWVDPDPTIESRVTRLERLMGAIRDQATEGFRLAESVDRLGLNAGALQEALLQVDRNQQTLTKLGKELEETKAVVVPRAEHETMERQRRQELWIYRKHILRQIYAYSLVAAAVLLGVGVFASSYLHGVKERQFQVCQDRNASTTVVDEYLAAVVDSSTNPRLRQEAQKVIDATTTVDCEVLR